MLVYELREILEGMDDGDEVRIILDQYMPMEYHVSAVTAVDAGLPDVDDEPERETVEEPVVYVVTGDQIGYASRRAAATAGARFS